jgi:hypothetical protein
VDFYRTAASKAVNGRRFFKTCVLGDGAKYTKSGTKLIKMFEKCE